MPIVFPGATPTSSLLHPGTPHPHIIILRVSDGGREPELGRIRVQNENEKCLKPSAARVLRDTQNHITLRRV